MCPQKEEDFVTNTYSRTLLETIDGEAIRKIIRDERASLSSLAGEVSDDLIAAFDTRLLLRDAFLEIIEVSQTQYDPDVIRSSWKAALEIVARLKSSHALGKAVPEASSDKLQRKLASTMPPRPIVHLPFDDAVGKLKLLFEDGLEVIDVLNYTDSQCLQVRTNTYPVIISR